MTRLLYIFCFLFALFLNKNNVLAQTLIPFSGSNSVACGTNTTLCTHAGCGSAYSANANGYTVLNATGTAVITISGTYYTELNYDYIRIYDGSGTGGTLLATYHASAVTAINYTGAAGQTLTVQFTSDGSVQNTGLNATVTYSGVCVNNTVIPFSGSNSVACGTNTTLCTHAGCGIAYSANANGYTVLNAAGSAVINISGTYYTELNYDYIRIYNGSGTGGTLLATYHASAVTALNYTGTAGQTLTVQFTSDGSVQNTGLNATVTYSGSCAVCSAPTTQASNINFTGVGCTSMTVNWTNGNGSKRIVKCNTSNSFTNPVNGTDPAANSVYGGGEQVVYNGTGTSVNITGLSAGNTYWFRVYEANCSGASIIFLTSTATNNPLSQATSPATPSVPGVISGTASQCPNLTGQVYSISAVSGATTYNWTVPAGWSITSGSGTTSITVTTGNSGQNGNITVTAGNSCGTSGASSLSVTVLAVSIPNGGPDQYICSSISSATMAATGTGTWTQISGPAATITTPSSPTTTVTGLVSGTYEFRWNSVCGGTYDDVVIIRQ